MRVLIIPSIHTLSPHLNCCPNQAFLAVALYASWVDDTSKSWEVLHLVELWLAPKWLSNCRGWAECSIFNIVDGRTLRVTRPPAGISVIRSEISLLSGKAHKPAWQCWSLSELLSLLLPSFFFPCTSWLCSPIALLPKPLLDQRMLLHLLQVRGFWNKPLRIEPMCAVSHDMCVILCRRSLE